jgi:IMP dehydrogenase
MSNKEQGSIMKYAYTFDDIQITPVYSEIESRSQCELITKFTKRYVIGTPLVSSPMDTVTDSKMALSIASYGGVGIIHRFMKIDEQVKHVLKVKEQEKLVSAAIGATGDYQERATALANAGAIVLLIDVAHGNTKQVKDAIKWCKENLPEYVDMIAGNVSTREGARNLAEWGSDAIRIGIGGGSVCSTRIRTGIGIPQVTAIVESIRGVELSGIDVPIIADGGIRMPGDVAKALSLGADSVMIGSLFAGTRESPGEIQRTGSWPNEQLFKKYRGAASFETKRTHGLEEKNVEGESKLIPYKGKVERIINDIKDGVRSSMSYVNARTIEEFRSNSEHVLITQNGLIEAKPHLLL